MRIKDLLKKEIMIMDLKAKTKAEVIEELVKQLDDKNYLNDKEEFKGEIIKREEEFSTALGDRVALPHAKTKAVKEPIILFARSESGVDYDALDGEDTNIFFLIAASENAHDIHIKTLASLAKLIMKEGFIDSLIEARTEDEVFDLIEKAGKENIEKEKIENRDKEKPFIVAVTACPTGIAHTYMAEESLKDYAKKIGVEIKVETNGSDGIENKLSKEDIEKAIGVIVAADTRIDMERFDGKALLDTRVADGVTKASELIDRTLKGDLEIYRFKNEKSTEDDRKKKTSGAREIYDSIMNGVSHMLPFVVGGGIILAISFLFERFFGSESIVFKFLNGLGQDTFTFLIPVMAGYIAISIGDRPALLPGMVAGLIASKGAGFLGGLLGGFLAGYIVVFLKNLTKKLPPNLEGLKPVLIYPVLSLLLTGFVMYFLVDPIFSALNRKIESILLNLGILNSVLLGFILGGMMAIDMGGPFNKAAYTFSIGIFTDTGNGGFMAAVMAGGMVPPLALAIATTLFKDKFSEKERQAGVTNYILGLSFITEGAIPFAAADPVRVILTSMLGAGIAGGMTQFFGIESPAPHGGIFIVPAMSQLYKGLLFIISVLVGSIIAGVLYGLVRQKKT